MGPIKKVPFHASWRDTFIPKLVKYLLLAELQWSNKDLTTIEKNSIFLTVCKGMCRLWESSKKYLVWVIPNYTFLTRQSSVCDRTLTTMSVDEIFTSATIETCCVDTVVNVHLARFPSKSSWTNALIIADLNRNIQYGKVDSKKSSHDTWAKEEWRFYGHKINVMIQICGFYRHNI